MLSRVGIVGFGSAGQRALQVARQFSPESDVLVVSRTTEAASDIRVSSRIDDMLAFNPDVLIIAGPASGRLATVQSIADLDCGVLFEKPLASTAAQARHIIDALGQRAGVCQVGYNLRFSESLQFFREQVRDGALGRILSVEAATGQYLPSWRPGSDYRESVSARSELGGGVLLELSHEIDYLRWILGPIIWVSAWTGTVSSLEIDVDDLAHIIFGATPLDGGREVVGRLSLDFVRHDRTRTLTVVAERGSLRWDGVAGTVAICEEGAPNWRQLMADSGIPHTYERQWQDFLQRQDNGDAAGVSLDEALEVLMVTDAIRESHLNEGCRTRVGRETL